MYRRYFGFGSSPFAVTPDPAFLYLGHSHREAFGHLLYGAGEQGGFVALIGEVGTGKTTLIRAMVENDTPDLDIALCWNPHLSVTEFLATICDELGVDYDVEHDITLKTLVDRLNAHLLRVHAGNRRTVLIIDEAQNLSREVLEQLRLLTNLETHKDKLLRVILVGQPELEAALARHDLRQLAQRITARFRLQPLGLAETREYVRHRLARAKGPQYLFSLPAIMVLHLLTHGVPRLINMVCERALMGAYAHGRAYVGPWTVMRAAAEALPARPRRTRSRSWRLALPTGAVALTGIVVTLAWLPDIPLTTATEWIRGAHAGGHQGAQVESKKKDLAAPTHSSDPQAADPPAGTTGETSASAPDSRNNDPAGDDGSAGGGYRNQARGGAVAEDKSQSGTSADKPPLGSGDNGKAGAKGEPKNDSYAFPKGDADINQVLRLWGRGGAQVVSDCANLHAGDLRCLDDTGDFATLKRYDRPALLMLKEKNQRQTVLLSGVNDNGTVTLVGANATRDVDRQRLLKRWTGRFEVIWRSDAGVKLIQPGSIGSAVVWLRKRFMHIDERNPDKQMGKLSPIYDEALGQRLKTFQKSHGLKADGIAGPRTQIILNGAVPSPGAPSLTPVKHSETK